MEFFKVIVALIFLLDCIYWIWAIFYFYTGTAIIISIVGYIAWKFLKEEKSSSKALKPAPPPNPNPYTLEELQNHLDAYRQKAIRSGGSDKWKCGRRYYERYVGYYERYIGYLLEKQGYKVIYNGETEGNFGKGIDLICKKNNEVRLIQCKRCKNSVGAEYIKRFNYAVEYFKSCRSEYHQVKPFFYSTSGYTAEAYAISKIYGIKICYEKFDSIREYPPVKCINSHGVKIYFLPFDKNFDKVPSNFDILMCYKFTVADAERAGYHYHLNQDVLLKDKW